jgi:hypothetical protein
MALFGNVLECGFNEELDLGGCGEADKRFIPALIHCFAARENNRVQLCGAAQMRGREFDDATHTAGAQMIVNDDEFQFL